MGLKYLPQNLFYGNKNKIVFFSYLESGYLSEKIRMPFKIPSVKLVVCHGDKNGFLSIAEPERYNNSEYRFLCCYPKMAQERYPELSFLFPTFPGVTPFWIGFNRIFFAFEIPSLDDVLFYLNQYEGTSNVFRKCLSKNLPNALKAGVNDRK